jgi:hypothetical protein
VDIAGHDIGVTVAYSFAANDPEAAPDRAAGRVAPRGELVPIHRAAPARAALRAVVVAFNQLRGLPEQLIAGRSRHLIDWIVDYMAADAADIADVADFDRAVYAHAS